MGHPFSYQGVDRQLIEGKLMPNRIIKSIARKSSIQLTDCLSSLFALELLSPSRALYLFSPWLSDVLLLHNSFGQFRAIIPELSENDLRLADLLNILAERGTLARIVCRPDQPHTEDFLRKLSSSIKVKQVETLHEKGLVSEHFYLRGSMNFTFSGIHLNDEHVELTTEPHQVALALAEAQQRWETL
jgi:hypothetical protein